MTKREVSATYLRKIPTRTIVVTYRPPARVWSQNERMHWAASAALRREWRQASLIYTKMMIERNRYKHPLTDLAHVEVALPFVTRQRRDAHNYTGTVVKAIIDGMTDAGLFVDDDTEHVNVLDPLLIVGARAVEVTVTW